MAGGAEGHLAGLAVEHQVEHGCHHLLHAAHHEPVDPGHNVGRRGLHQPVGAERVAELAHRRGRAEAVARHVAHHQRHAAVGALEHVVPVAPDRRAARARQVAGGQLHALDRRQPLRQEAALERLGDRVLALVHLEQPGLHRLPLVDVDGRAHVAGEAAALEPRQPAVHDPAVLARAAAEPVLLLPRAALRPGGVPGRGREGRRRPGARRAPSSPRAPPGRSCP